MKTLTKIGFATIVIALAFMLIGTLQSCNHNHREPRKRATQVVNYEDKSIIIETLHDGYIKTGIHKVVIDSNQYIIVKGGNTGESVAIIKHN